MANFNNVVDPPDSMLVISVVVVGNSTMQINYVILIVLYSLLHLYKTLKMSYFDTI